MRGLHLATLSLLVLFVATTAPPAMAGTFVMQNVWAETEDSTFGDSTLVMIGAEAVYEGPVDPNDGNWAIQTNLHHLMTTTQGQPVSGGSLPTVNMKIQVDPRQHGAFKEILDCGVDGNPQQYQGEGVVAIYHQYTPEFSTLTSPWLSTDCTQPPPEGGGGTPDPDGGSDDPPQTGTGGMCDHIQPCTPVLVDLDSGGFRLTPWQRGVRFDLNRDGEAEWLSWTERGGGDAWLALDRNRNGRIDDGGELFGNFTDQPATDHPHGYRALALFDADGDGRITTADPVFPDLLLWTDRNGDGASQAGELMTLSRAAIQWIDLDVVESRARDRYGNELRYRARVGRSSGNTQSVDVFLLSPP